jgi:hypothetical protein
MAGGFNAPDPAGEIDDDRPERKGNHSVPSARTARSNPMDGDTSAGWHLIAPDLSMRRSCRNFFRYLPWSGDDRSETTSRNTRPFGCKLAVDRTDSDPEQRWDTRTYWRTQFTKEERS